MHFRIIQTIRQALIISKNTFQLINTKTSLSQNFLQNGPFLTIAKASNGFSKLNGRNANNKSFGKTCKQQQ